MKQGSACDLNLSLDRQQGLSNGLAGDRNSFFNKVLIGSLRLWSGETECGTDCSFTNFHSAINYHIRFDKRKLLYI